MRFIVRRDALLSELDTIEGLAERCGITTGSMKQFRQMHIKMFPQPVLVLGNAKLYSIEEVMAYRQKSAVEYAIKRLDGARKGGEVIRRRRMIEQWRQQGEGQL